MIYKEVEGDLFTVSDDYCLAHCISSDTVMAAGIAPLFVRKFPGMKQNIKSRFPEVGEAIIWEYDDWGEGQLKHTVFNLITKERAYNKPTYATLEQALISMFLYMHEDDSPYKKVAIPLIGCGLDGLKWPKVKEIIKSVFANTDIEVLVYFYDDWAIPLMERNQKGDGK